MSYQKILFLTKKNQLVSETENGLTSQYYYDNRGNIKTVVAGNEIIKQIYRKGVRKYALNKSLKSIESKLEGKLYKNDIKNLLTNAVDTVACVL